MTPLALSSLPYATIPAFSACTRTLSRYNPHCPLRAFF